MRRGSWIVVVLGLLFAKKGLAQEAAFCKPACSEEQRVCKQNGRGLAADHGDGVQLMPQRNELARTAEKTQGASHAQLAGERAGEQSRRMRHDEACEASYARCTRACAVPAAPAPDSPVLTNRRKNS